MMSWDAANELDSSDRLGTRHIKVDDAAGVISKKAEPLCPPTPSARLIENSPALNTLMNDRG
jgi:hypothetical protein